MKEMLKDKKKLAIIASILLVLLVIVVVLVVMPKKDNNNEETLEESLKKLGVEFYEEKYYTTFEDVTKLANYKDTGLNISLTNLNVTLPISTEIKEKLDDEKCNLDNTKIRVYPTSPYGAKDYKIEVELACEK